MEYPIVMRPGEENVSSFKYNLIHLQSIKLMCGGRSFFFFFFLNNFISKTITYTTCSINYTYIVLATYTTLWR